MKLTLEIEDLTKILSSVLRRALTPEEIVIDTNPFRLEIGGLGIEDLQKVQNTIESTPSKPSQKSVNTTVEDVNLGLLVEKSRNLESQGGGAGPVPTDQTRIPDDTDEIPEEFLPPGASYDPPPPGEF